MTHLFKKIDCVKGMRSLRPLSVDVVVTSPPYNIGVKYRTYRDRLPRHIYLDWLGEVAQGIRRVLKDDGSLFLNVGNKPSDQWIAWDVASRFREHFVLQNTIHWIKAIDDRGHFKPINSDRFVNDCHEFVFHFTKRGDVSIDRLAIGLPYQDKSNVRRWSGKRDLRCRGNTWLVPYKTIQAERGHPATFPVKLAEMCLRLHGVSRASLVVDPFAGIGTTAQAAALVGSSSIGFDIDGRYLALARRAVAKTLQKSD